MHRSISVCGIVLFLLVGCYRDDAHGKNDVQDLKKVTVESNPLPPVESSVSGEYIKAFLTAYEAFKEEQGIPAEKRKLENYTVEFRHKGDSILVLFFAKRLPSEQGLVGGESQLGRDVLYSVSNQDYRLLGRNCFK